jgi:hypothetical protein
MKLILLRSADCDGYAGFFNVYVITEDCRAEKAVVITTVLAFTGSRAGRGKEIKIL